MWVRSGGNRRRAVHSGDERRNLRLGEEGPAWWATWMASIHKAIHRFPPIHGILTESSRLGCIAFHAGIPTCFSLKTASIIRSLPRPQPACFSKNTSRMPARERMRVLPRNPICGRLYGCSQGKKLTRRAKPTGSIIQIDPGAARRTAGSWSSDPAGPAGTRAGWHETMAPSARRTRG